MDSNEVGIGDVDTCATMEWVRSLHTDHDKARDEITDLLNHASEDGMSEGDRRECLMGLKLLDLEETGGTNE